jgi:hypothetical protein
VIGAHPSAEHLDRFARGEGTKGENFETLRHLSSGCSDCQATLAGAAISRRTLGETPPDLDQTAIDRIVRRVREREAELWSERAEAPGQLQELLRHPPSQRATLVRNLKRFQTWGLCELLISESYARRFSDTEEGVALADLGVLAAESLDTSHYGEALAADMRGLALAHLANARRLTSDLPGAEEALSRAERLLENGTGDPLHEARVFEMRANLRSAQRRFSEALRASKRAESRYAMVDDRHKIGSVLVQRTVILTKMGEQSQVEAILRRSLGLLDPERDRREPLLAKTSLVFLFNSLGRFAEAQELLRGLHAAFSDLGDTLTALRVLWLEANTTEGLREFPRAENLYREVHAGFVAAEIPYDVALVSLDLAALYLEQGRTAEVKAIANEVVAVFLALQIHREAYAAAILFQQAVAAETVTLALTKRLAQYLREAQSNPGLAFCG